MFKQIPFQDVLKSLRVRQGKEWTQEKTATLLGVSKRTYAGWENGERFPSPRDLQNIAAAFRLNDTETDTLFHAASHVAPKIHNLPFLQNRLFTGRSTLLSKVERLFEKNNRVSLSGLGGIGKTQIALEYAHRSACKEVYRSIMWVNAANKATIEASYLSLACLLKLAENNAKDVNQIVQAVKIWLEEHTRWLLILDNVEELELACSFLPTRPLGHILLTTRTQIVSNIAALIKVEAMEPKEGLLFLLRRVGMLEHETELDTIAPDTHSTAEQLVERLGGHPLALDQAGAYIEETRDHSVEVTGTSFREYMQIYQEQHHTLLARRGSLGDPHPETVVATIEASFKKACELCPTCADVLYFCSLLHSDQIAEELVKQGTGLNLHPHTFNNAILALRSYSLIERYAEKKLLFLPPLVKVVIIDTLPQHAQRPWINCLIGVLSRTFPTKSVNRSWREQLLPHLSQRSDSAGGVF
jgi:transcriptional regulator with XRE-family HTH domain